VEVKVRVVVAVTVKVAEEVTVRYRWRLWSRFLWGIVGVESCVSAGTSHRIGRGLGRGFVGVAVNV